MKALEWIWVEEAEASTTASRISLDGEEEPVIAGLHVRFRNDEGVLMFAQFPIHYELAEDMHEDEALRHALLQMAVEQCESVMEENRHTKRSV